MMGYRIDVDAAASAEAARVLRAVEGGLNRHFLAQAQSSDTSGSGGSIRAGSSDGSTCPPGMDCASGKLAGDQLHSLVPEFMAAVGIAFFIGVFVGVQIGKRSAPVAK